MVRLYLEQFPIGSRLSYQRQRKDLAEEMMWKLRCWGSCVFIAGTNAPLKNFINCPVMTREDSESRNPKCWTV